MCMVSIQEIVNSCIDQIRVAPNLLPIYSQMLSNKHDEYTEDEITIALQAELIVVDSIDDKLSQDNTRPPTTINKNPLVYVDKKVEIPKLSGLHWGLSRKKHERKMYLITKMSSIIYSSKYGISKTEILRRLGKDNSHWRNTLTNWLNEMVDGDLLKKEGHRYFSPQISLETRERRLHRLVFESLGSGPLSTTAIAKQIGYDGGNNRGAVKTVIEDLNKDGYIKCVGIKWCWTR